MTVTNTNSAVSTTSLNVSIRGQKILEDINVHFPENQISAIVGPSGSGKSTLLRCLNQIGQMTEGYKENGSIQINGVEISEQYNSLEMLRQDVGMVFQSACIFPTSIAKNVVFGIARQRKLSRTETREIVEKSLRMASLWDEVKDRLHRPAARLSLGQKQRLCIARVLAMQPKILLMDEPTASLDPLSVQAIEEVLTKLKTEFSIIFVTHDLDQMIRIADHIVFIDNGHMITQGDFLHFKQCQDNEKINKYFARVLK